MSTKSRCAHQHFDYWHDQTGGVLVKCQTCGAYSIEHGMYFARAWSEKHARTNHNNTEGFENENEKKCD